jgi:hypothetical protein
VNNFDIYKSGGVPETQRSKPLDYTITVNTVDILQIEYNVTKACSDIFLHVILDNSEILTTEHVGPISGQYTTGLIDLGSLKQGRHKLTLSPEGVPNNDDDSCNYGTLGSWGGILTVYTSEYP